MIIDPNNLNQVKAVLTEAKLSQDDAEYFQYKLQNLRPTKRHLNGQEVIKIEQHYFTCCLFGDKVKVTHDGHCNQYGDYMSK